MRSVVITGASTGIGWASAKLLLGRGFEMRVEQLHLALKFGLDLGQLNLRLNLDLLMDDVVLGFLLFNLRLVCRSCLIRLRPRLQCQ